MSRWLDPPADGAERLVWEGLGLAAARVGDEIARRRVWTRIGDLDPARPPAPVGGPRSRLMLGLAGAALGLAAGVLLMLRAGRAPDVPVLAGDRASGPVPVPAVVDRAEIPLPVPVPVAGVGTLRTVPGQTMRIALRGGIEAELGSNTEIVVEEARAPRVRRGRVSLDVPRQAPGDHFAVAAGAYGVVVVGTRFHVRVAGDSVGVDVDEGVVEMRDARGQALARVTAGGSWTSPSPGESPPRARSVQRAGGGRPVPDGTAARAAVVATPTPGATRALPAAPTSVPAARPVDPFREAQAALAAGHPARAAAILDALAQGDGPAAENAAYELGRVLRDRLVRPREALRAWQRYRARFPRGLLRAEVDVSVLEVLVVLGDHAAAAIEAQEFLVRHPGSERRAEVEAIQRRLAGINGTPAP